MTKEHIDGFGEFEFYPDYFIGQINEGVNAGYDYVDALSELIQKHYSGRPVIYISDRVNSYSLDPFATMDLIKRNNIRFAAIVTYTNIQKTDYPFEEKIIEGISMRSFNSLATAVIWAEQKQTEL